MPSTATPTHAAPALPLLPIAPLDGADGYLRWKESVLLRLRTIDMAYVLFQDRPAGDAAKKWARDDELCRGHILATLSDRLLPVYAHHATAGAVWRTVARTYDLDMSIVWSESFFAFQFTEDEPVLEQLARLEAFAAGAKLEDPAGLVLPKLSSDLAKAVNRDLPVPEHHSRPRMEDIWKTARLDEVLDMADAIKRNDDHQSAKRRRRRGPCHNCGEQGHIARECRA